MADKNEGMRLTARRGRGHKGGSNYGAKHNDRDFPTENTPHIDPEKSKNNIYWQRYQKKHPELSFEDAEKKFYEETFRKGLDAQNKRYGYHKERHKTMDELREQRRTSPEEMIFQIGNAKVGQPSIAKIHNAFVQFQNWHMKAYPQIKLLDYALHADEFSVHIQSRQVYIGHDKDGNAIPNQNRCLEETKIALPNPEKKEGRYNNRKMTYTKICREKLFEICREMGLELIEEPKEHGQSGLSLAEYKTREEQAKLEKTTQELAERKQKTFEILQQQKLAGKLETYREDSELQAACNFVKLYDPALYEMLMTELERREKEKQRGTQILSQLENDPDVKKPRTTRGEDLER